MWQKGSVSTGQASTHRARLTYDGGALHIPHPPHTLPPLNTLHALPAIMTRCKSLTHLIPYLLRTT